MTSDRHTLLAEANAQRENNVFFIFCEEKRTPAKIKNKIK
jgi:hypothetical protein